MDIAQYLADLLADHDEVSVPGFGIVYREKIPARFNETTRQFEPPSSRLAFKEGPGTDDVLIRHISTVKHISASSAEFFAGRFGEELRRQLDRDGRADFSPVGLLERSGERIHLIAELETEDRHHFGLKPVAEWSPDEAIEETRPAEALPVAEAVPVAEAELPAEADLPAAESPVDVDEIEEDVILPVEPERQAPVEPASVLPVKHSDYVQEPPPEQEISPLFDRIVLRDKNSWLEEIPEDYGVEPRRRRPLLTLGLFGVFILAGAAALYFFWEPVSATWNKAVGIRADSVVAVKKADTLTKVPLVMPIDTLGMDDSLTRDSLDALSDSSRAAVATQGYFYVLKAFSRMADVKVFMDSSAVKGIPTRILSRTPQIRVSLGEPHPDRKSANAAMIELRTKLDDPTLFVNK